MTLAMLRLHQTGAMEAGFRCKAAFEGNGWSIGRVCACHPRSKAEGEESSAIHPIGVVHTLHLRGSVSGPKLTEPQQTTRVLGLGQRTRHLPRSTPPKQLPSDRALPSTPSMTRGLRGVALLQKKSDVVRSAIH
jgi:hypothetical protein